MTIDLNKLFDEFKRRNNIYEVDDRKTLIEYWHQFISWLKQQIWLD